LLDVLLLDVAEPELDGATELELDDPGLSGEEDEALELGVALLLDDALCGVVADELVVAFEAPDEHPGSTSSTHRPAIASGLRRTPSERRPVQARAGVKLMRICGTLPSQLQLPGSTVSAQKWARPAPCRCQSYGKCGTVAETLTPTLGFSTSRSRPPAAAWECEWRSDGGEGFPGKLRRPQKSCPGAESTASQHVRCP
jgi:hypothetical protein